MTALLMLVALPHALEDFYYGDFVRAGITPATSYPLLAGNYIVQLVGIALLIAGKRAGALVLAFMGVVWLIGDVSLHGHDFAFAGPDYRHGFVSKLLEVVIFVLGAACAVMGWRAWRLLGPR